jgi:hypothetical protein
MTRPETVRDDIPVIAVGRWRYSPTRIVAVTAGLVLAGGVAGGLAGGIAALLVGIVIGGGKDVLADPFLFFLFGASFGGRIGAVLLPLFAWLVLRHVPLGRALAFTIPGAIVGGLVGALLPIGTSLLPSIVGGTIGFALAGIAARVVTARKATASPQARNGRTSD